MAAAKFRHPVFKSDSLYSENIGQLIKVVQK